MEHPEQDLSRSHHEHHEHHGRHGHHEHHGGHRVPFEELRDDTVICRCCGLTFSDVRNAAEHGAASAEEAAAWNSCQFLCRKCVDYMESVIQQLKV